MHPKTPTWLGQNPNLRRDENHRYWVGDEVIAVSTTGVCGHDMTDFRRQQIEVTRHEWEPRGVNTHLALQLELEARFHPSYGARQKAAEQRIENAEAFAQFREHIAPLVTHPLWSEVEVIATEYMVASRELNLAGTFDGAFREEDKNSSDGYSYTIFDLKTQKKGGRPYSVKAQLGCYISLCSESGVRFDNAMVIWSRPNETRLQSLTADECLTAWRNKWSDYCKQERTV